MTSTTELSLNLFTISMVVFISNPFLLSVVSQNITFNNFNRNNSFIQNYLSDIKVNKSFNESFALNGRTLSEILLNKSSNESQSNSSLFIRELLKQMAENERNASESSESRTLSSWLGLDRIRRPNFKLNPFQSSPSRAQSQVVNPLIAPQLPFPQFLSRPNSFPGPHDPESLILPPSLFEDSGIKYWLKFIENAGKDDISESEDYDSIPFSKPVNVLRPQRPPYSPRKPYSPPKPIDIGEKPNDENANLYEDNEESDDQNDEEDEEQRDKHKVHEEPKSSGTSSTHNKQTFDTSPRCDKFTADICVDDFEYPEQAIVDEIYKRRELFELMYSEVRDNSPLVDGIPRDVEESYNYDYYDDGKDPQTSSSSAGKQEKKSNPRRGFVCPTEVMYGKPKLAKNKRGDWKVIVNAAEFTQTVRMEKCLKPNSKCNYISYPDFDSRCAQVHSFHRLLVFEKGKGFYIDTFRIPTACTCHVTRRVSYKPMSSSEYRPVTNRKRKPPQQSQPLSNTLWSILGGPLPSEGSSMSQSQDMVRNQINLLQQLKHFPQLSHISPDNVFQQLMDLQSTSDDMVLPQKSYSPQKQNPLSFGQSNIDYILPSLMMNEDQTNGDRRPHSQMSRPLAQIHQSSGTTTLLNPNNNGAPVVQVIHVPVTSAVSPNSDPVPVYKSKPNQQFNDFSFVDTSSLFLKPKPSSDEFLQTFGDDFSQISVNSFKPLMLGMSSKTNSSLMSPNSDKEQSIRRESEASDTKASDSDETNKKRKVMVESSLNKKINFSYHPILEYIST